jgi:hypothetical protein
MPINAVSGKVESQELNDNFSFLDSQISILSGKATNILSDPYFAKFPNQTTNFLNFFRKDSNGDLEAYLANTSVHSIYTNAIVFEPFVQLSFKINVDKTKNFGTLVGFQTDSTHRLLFGYEPAYGTITVYFDGVFSTLISSANVTNGEYEFIFRKYADGTMILTVDGVDYNLKNYQPTAIFDFTAVRMQLKTTDLGLKVKGLALSFVQLVSNTKVDSSIKKYNNFGSIRGKKTHIYKFGGKGNDWCFVRTPANYDPQGKPHPLIICNHGNGWVMDGTEAMANYTSKTQYGVDTQNNNAYLNTSDPYYVKYSNPTIEKLLEAGYVVAGAQNFADNLYGNKDCRQACQDFYFHLIKNFNVEEKCFMIGASNGALTSLNAMYLLGGVARVKAILLQYPLTTLWKHYTNYPSHQAAIETAYGIVAGLSESAFESATRTHDPEKVGTVVISGVRQKLNGIPPIKIYYANGDTVAVPENNTIPFTMVLENGNCIFESTDVGAYIHGDWHHFNPQETLNFFEKYR